MPIITDIKGRIIFNSRGSKTIEVDIISDYKFLGRASSPDLTLSLYSEYLSAIKPPQVKHRTGINTLLKKE